MREPVRKQLIDALRSGKYQHFTGALRCGDCFCALGVLCDISNLGNWRQGRYVVNDTVRSTSCIPPDPVLKWADLPYEEMDRIWEKNDRYSSYDAVIRHLECQQETKS